MTKQAMINGLKEIYVKLDGLAELWDLADRYAVTEKHMEDSDSEFLIKRVLDCGWTSTRVMGYIRNYTTHKISVVGLIGNIVEAFGIEELWKEAKESL